MANSHTRQRPLGNSTRLGAPHKRSRKTNSNNPRTRGPRKIKARSSRKRKGKTSQRGEGNIICTACARLFSVDGLEDLNSRDGLSHRTRRECLNSRGEGCSLCGFIFELVLQSCGDQWTAGERLAFWNIGPLVGEQTPGINVLKGGFGAMPDAITITPFAKAGNPAADLIARRPLHRDVQSESVLSAAKDLIHACMRTDQPDEAHKQCQFSRDTILPTRVLDLGEPGAASPVLRLQVNKIETHGAYLALSYCWGKPDPKVTTIKLQTKNLESLMSGIDFDTVPRTIQDAIKITRKLGFRYLWVDSLCIMQNQEADKIQEISVMAAIYKNAAVTLAASVAKTSSEGFLAGTTDEATAYLPDYKFRIPTPRNGVGEIYLVGNYEPDHPLDKRGWTLQEFMLSSRMLIFSDYELLWQCNKVPLRGVVGEGGIGAYLQRIESLPWLRFDDSAEPDFGSHDFEMRYLWRTIIHQFTERNLSFGEDRLRAMAGVVSELETLWRDVSVYGHWRRWFVQLLSWYKPEVNRVEERYLQRAPSWSWVSIDGVIRYEMEVEVEDARVKSLTVEMAVLTCRMMRCEDVKEDLSDSVKEMPDLQSDPAMEEVGERDCAYLLLGGSGVDDGCRRGVGLLVLETGGGQYRRVGLAIFLNMSIWEGVEPRDITLEPKM